MRSRLKKNPREIAQALVNAIKEDSEYATLIQTIEIAGPGFINFRLNTASKFSVISEVLKKRKPSVQARNSLVRVFFLSTFPLIPLVPYI